MANYATNTSDKSKHSALVFWFVGGLGLLGLENYYVLKFKKSSVAHTLLGLMFLIAASALPKADFEAGMPVVIIVLFWAFLGLPNLIKILFGLFRDNVGQPLRK